MNTEISHGTDDTLAAALADARALNDLVSSLTYSDDDVCASILAEAVPRARALAEISIYTYARGLADGRARARARALADALAAAYTHARILHIDTEALAPVPALAAALADAHTRARALADDLDRASMSPESPRRHRGLRVAPAATRLAVAAARLLPSPERARYTEEFRCELWDLAAAGASRWEQLAHAARVTARTAAMRPALRAPMRRGAVP